MSRYGWARSGNISPYSSMSGGLPNVTDQDFEYITSQDLDDPSLGIPVDRHRSRSNASPDPADDVLLIKNRGVTYPAHFPAYTIGDGKLRVMDVKERIGLMMDLPERTLRRIKLLYKGKQLKEPAAPIREYGVKNKSEIMAVVPEGGDSSPSEGEMVNTEPYPGSKKKKNKKRSKKKSSKDGDSTSSPRDSASGFDTQSPPSGSGSESSRKLDELAAEYRNNWLPLCSKFIASPPDDEKARDDEHRKVSESILQRILLKADDLDVEGQPDVRARRKALINEVQEKLKEVDRAKGIKSPLA